MTGKAIKKTKKPANRDSSKNKKTEKKNRVRIGVYMSG